MTPKYFMYFPGNYRWSAAFVNMLGRAAYGGADISELHKIGRALAGKAAEDDEAWFDACVSVADEVRGHFGDHVGEIDLHVSQSSQNPLGGGADTAPIFSSANATRSAMSSRQGGAISCTPIGIGWSGTGAATTGRPMKEIGWV